MVLSYAQQISGGFERPEPGFSVRIISPTNHLVHIRTESAGGILRWPGIIAGDWPGLRHCEAQNLFGIWLCRLVRLV